jgi:hypothetical protein
MSGKTCWSVPDSVPDVALEEAGAGGTAFCAWSRLVLARTITPANIQRYLLQMQV